MDEHILHFKQYVKCCTRVDKALDSFYYNLKKSYKVQKKDPLGDSDHSMLYALPKYKQELKSIKPTNITVSEWSADVIDKIRGCFDLCIGIPIPVYDSEAN